ncbi:hypothetical protein F7725_008745 [Dissostichus mawsoni]|uniref:Uncharacterized protein n=1 Tax=Dissostichus mawsoni TaxID=36200 RepID=A0A7J5Y809_DISMA|nr:hypothetical protein F7725_008745 [Dissostichus mawsoni]
MLLLCCLLLCEDEACRAGPGRAGPGQQSQRLHAAFESFSCSAADTGFSFFLRCYLLGYFHYRTVTGCCGMGDAQSAHRDAEAAEERSGDARDDEQETGDKPLINNGQVSEISGKAESSIAEVNGLCEEQIPAEEKDDSETEKPLKEEETPLENVEISEKESPNEADEDLTVKSGSGDVASDDTDVEDPNRPEDVEDTTKETTSENPEENTDLNMAQETYDNDSKHILP